MREIKFRAWDKKNKKMLEVDILFINEKMFRPVDGREYDVWNYDTEYFSNPLQYTGLKDKSNKEIYDGDLLKVELDWGYGLAKIIVEIYFKDGCFRAKALNSHEDTLLIELPPCEVVGNVYENPELLKEDK